jgi:hypothetical protein
MDRVSDGSIENKINGVHIPLLCTPLAARLNKRQQKMAVFQLMLQPRP